jgi:hypothetical protein
MFNPSAAAFRFRKEGCGPALWNHPKAARAVSAWPGENKSIKVVPNPAPVT